MRCCVRVGIRIAFVSLVRLIRNRIRILRGLVLGTSHLLVLRPFSLSARPLLRLRDMTLEEWSRTTKTKADDPIVAGDSNPGQPTKRRKERKISTRSRYTTMVNDVGTDPLEAPKFVPLPSHVLPSPPRSANRPSSYSSTLSALQRMLSSPSSSRRSASTFSPSLRQRSVSLSSIRRLKELECAKSRSCRTFRMDSIDCEC